MSAPIILAYDTDGHLICTTDPNGVAIQDAYNPAGQLTSVQAANGQGAACNPPSTTGTPSGSVFSRYTSKYTTAGSPQVDRGLRQTANINGTAWQYTYDALSRLTHANSLAYGPDGDGNLLMKGTAAFTFNNADQITNTGYVYDPDGNLLARADPGGTTSLGYNSRNQTTSINPDAQGAQALSYLASGQTDPIQTGTAPAGGTPPSVTDTPLGISSQTTAGGGGQTAATTYYTRAPNGTLLGERTPNGNYYYTPDANRSILALTNSTGSVANTYTYDPYGTTTNTTGNIPNSFGFDSGFHAPGGLYLFGQRYYDPTTGTWTQPDPLPHLGSPTQSDPYKFAGGDPINRVDRSGLCIIVSCNTYHSVGNALAAGYNAVSNFTQSQVGDAVAGCVGLGVEALEAGPYVAAGACAVGGTAGYFGVPLSDAYDSAKRTSP